MMYHTMKMIQMFQQLEQKKYNMKKSDLIIVIVLILISILLASQQIRIHYLEKNDSLKNEYFSENTKVQIAIDDEVRALKNSQDYITESMIRITCISIALAEQLKQHLDQHATVNPYYFSLPWGSTNWQIATNNCYRLQLTNPTGGVDKILIPLYNGNTINCHGL